MKKTLASLAILLAMPAAAQRAEAPFVVGDTGYQRLQDAVDAIGEGRGTIRIAPGRYRQCAVQNAGEIAYVADQPGTAVFERATCEGKAALVLGGQSARVEGLTFQSLRVPDKNGAGIRIESGDLTVVESMFRDSENGILSASDPSGTIRVERSTFSGLGGCEDGHGCSHSLYIGEYGSLSVVRSRFERGTGGHYLKSRTPRIEVVDSSFDDTQGRASNYMIDLSNGATGTIARNTFVQGKDKENYSAFVMVAAEGADNSSAGLAITDNDARLAPGVDRNTSFVADESGDALRIENNRLGKGIRSFEKR
ncbi:right-handed parallel beta-helix repeat-containing protein [Allosphingosinicella indica]|uniref:Right handed beta helix region n=1 Tax=Allosphingosinicella indica TaxID=941907 RepID=A0A1X7G2X9_9SPHN|nr:right-handed parallel beta-helix repeat-containing protein [Allosphingosinicella indica]SMF63057.1 Right handed beta helix region [Allosphingosinicella indica]